MILDKTKRYKLKVPEDKWVYVLERLFDLGVVWIDGSTDVISPKPYLYIGKSLKLFFGIQLNSYNLAVRQEISWHMILNKPNNWKY